MKRLVALMMCAISLGAAAQGHAQAQDVCYPLRAITIHRHKQAFLRIVFGVAIQDVTLTHATARHYQVPMQRFSPLCMEILGLSVLKPP